VRPVGVDHGHGRLACLSLRARATSRRGGFQAARPHAGGGGAWSGKGAGMVEKERRKIGVETRAASTVRGGCARPVRQAAPVARATTEVGSKRNTQWPKPNEAAGAGPRAVTHCRGTRWPFPGPVLATRRRDALPRGLSNRTAQHRTDSTTGALLVAASPGPASTPRHRSATPVIFTNQQRGSERTRIVCFLATGTSRQITSRFRLHFSNGDRTPPRSTRLLSPTRPVPYITSPTHLPNHYSRRSAPTAWSPSCLKSFRSQISRVRASRRPRRWPVRSRPPASLPAARPRASSSPPRFVSLPHLP
jgi:hypothetical protein